MKFSFEREWIKAVRRARRRPNYGMGNSGRLRPGSKVLFAPQQGEENFGNLREYSRVSIVTVDHVSLLELVLRVFRG